MDTDHGTVFYKWKNEITATCKEYYMNQTFSDVTLVSDDNQNFYAHKIILAAASPAFKELLLSNEKKETKIFLQGITGDYVEVLLKLIYIGETNISNKNQEVMNVLECFGIDWLKDLHVEDLGTEQLLQETLVKEKSEIMDEHLPDLKKGRI